MHNSEWTLIFFTLLMQMSAGGFTFLVIRKFLKESTEQTAATKRNFLIVFAIGCCGLLLAFFHLGNPWHAYNALNNLGSSWMSAEILSVSVFLFTLFLLNLYFRKIFSFHKTVIP